MKPPKGTKQELVRIGYVAKKLGLDRRTVRKRLQADRILPELVLESLNGNGSVSYYLKKEIDSWLANQSQRRN